MKTGGLFDLDGTLRNTLGDIQSAVNHVYDYCTREEVRSYIGNGAVQLLRCLSCGKDLPL